MDIGFSRNRRNGNRGVAGKGKPKKVVKANPIWKMLHLDDPNRRQEVLDGMKVTVLFSGSVYLFKLFYSFLDAPVIPNSLK